MSISHHQDTVNRTIQRLSDDASGILISSNKAKVAWENGNIDKTVFAGAPREVVKEIIDTYISVLVEEVATTGEAMIYPICKFTTVPNRKASGRFTPVLPHRLKVTVMEGMKLLHEVHQTGEVEVTWRNWRAVRAAIRAEYKLHLRKRHHTYNPMLDDEDED